MRMIMHRVKSSDYLTFLRELPRSFSSIGAMLPSSARLGRAMVRSIGTASGPLNILEAGPGTGPFTRQILERMGDEDSFTVCEINPRFLERLRLGLAENPHYHRHQDRVEFYCAPVQDLPRRIGDVKFDIIVSSLPFSNFDPETVEEILGAFRRMLAPEGTITYFEYLGVRKLRVLRAPSARSRLKAVDEVLRHWREEARHSGEVHTSLSLLNVPPARAVECHYRSAQVH